MNQREFLPLILMLLLVAESRTQFFDVFGFPPLPAETNIFGIEHTTRRTKTTTKHIENTNTRKNKPSSIPQEDLDRDAYIPSSREKKRKETTTFPTLAPIFNFFTTTHRSRKNKTNSSRRNNTSNSNISSNSSENRRKNNNNSEKRRLAYDVDVSKVGQLDNWYEKPENVISYDTGLFYEVTTKAYNDRYNNDEYTTRNPFFNRPGVKPAVVDNRPPITNRPASKRPRPEDNVTVRSTTKEVTLRPYVVNPIPTDAGAVVFPSEDDQPEIIRGVDEDYMSDAEKRRYIEIAERMCDKYKALNTKQLSAIPLLPSPEPVQVTVSACAPTTVPLVVGGKVVSIREFPHAALLGWLKIDGAGYSWKCGGSLVSDQWILTAAHCSYQERDNTVVTGPPRVVQLGSTYLDDPGALVVKVAAVVRHPKYKFPRSYFDVALLKLAQPVTFSEVIKPACLGEPPPVGMPVIAAGWGKTEFGGDQSLELRAVSLPVWDIDRCAEALGTSRKMPRGPQSDSQLCAGEHKGGKDTCQGDSGGPVQVQDGCAWRVVAVTSLGRSCGAPSTPGLYALAHRPFIAAIIYKNYDNNKTIDNNQNGIKTTSTESYSNNYNNNQNFNNHNGIKTTTTTESYPNIYINDYDYNNRRKSTTTTESYPNNYNNDYNNRNRKTTTTTESYFNYNNHNNKENNRKTTSQPYYNGYNQNNQPSLQSNNQDDYKNNYNQPTTPKRNQRIDYDLGYYTPQKANDNQNVRQSNNQDYWSNHDYYGRSSEKYEEGRIWWTRK